MHFFTYCKFPFISLKMTRSVIDYYKNMHLDIIVGKDYKALKNHLRSSSTLLQPNMNTYFQERMKFFFVCYTVESLSLMYIKFSSKIKQWFFLDLLFLTISYVCLKEKILEKYDSEISIHFAKNYIITS